MALRRLAWDTGSYALAGMGLASTSLCERCLRVASIAWAVISGVLALIPQMMDYGPGGLGILLIYAFLGFVFGVVNPRYWRLACLSAWAVALLWSVLTVGNGVEWAVAQVPMMLLAPVLGALAGGWVGGTLRKQAESRIVRALRGTGA
jgi:hypothetical protein